MTKFRRTPAPVFLGVETARAREIESLIRGDDLTGRPNDHITRSAFPHLVVERYESRADSGGMGNDDGVGTPETAFKGDLRGSWGRDTRSMDRDIAPQVRDDEPSVGGTASNVSSERAGNLGEDNVGTMNTMVFSRHAPQESRGRVGLRFIAAICGDKYRRIDGEIQEAAVLPTRRAAVFCIHRGNRLVDPHGSAPNFEKRLDSRQLLFRPSRRLRSRRASLSFHRFGRHTQNITRSPGRVHTPAPPHGRLGCRR